MLATVAFCTNSCRSLLLCASWLPAVVEVPACPLWPLWSPTPLVPAVAPLELPAWLPLCAPPEPAPCAATVGTPAAVVHMSAAHAAVTTCTRLTVLSSRVVVTRDCRRCGNRRRRITLVQRACT